MAILRSEDEKRLLFGNTQSIKKKTLKKHYSSLLSIYYYFYLKVAFSSRDKNDSKKSQKITSEIQIWLIKTKIMTALTYKHLNGNS